ncbi:hypothetical protein R3W88_031280 [Solanum pinnatisectum]|uniref:AP2/ERF domain-containing protein n=1 Tax=Solanum pinnatisectum TaxID=50273 RepID=A0AAV9LLI8_9SOLN|nr:hypothetical protein R3W88_031280 [Solanum pinnatisectum]
MNDSSNSCSSIRTERSDEESILLVSSSMPKKRAAGRKKFKETRHPVFRGVRKRNNDKWVCEIREPTKQKRIWLGTYPTAEMAARAHDVAALALKGELATLNFADSAWRLQVPISKDPKELRQAAARAAEAFEPVREVAPQENNNNIVVDCNMVVVENDNTNSRGVEEWIANMKEKSLLSPNPCLFGSHFNWDDYVESDVEVSLWNYTI